MSAFLCVRHSVALQIVRMGRKESAVGTLGVTCVVLSLLAMRPWAWAPLAAHRYYTVHVLAI